jgi:gamma-glutamylcyclotransferase (GGCT)/AIG2-like uncharacterized protein YtfP
VCATLGSVSEHIACFVYGTLRVGQGNHRWAKDGTDERLNLIGATARGDLYFVSGRGAFPVANLDGSGIIHGDVIFFDPDSEEYRSVCSMERGAGYEARLIDVTLPNDSVIVAEAWHYRHPPRGEQIMDGDWAASQDMARPNGERSHVQ